MWLSDRWLSDRNKTCIFGRVINVATENDGEMVNTANQGVPCHLIQVHYILIVVLDIWELNISLLRSTIDSEEF